MTQHNEQDTRINLLNSLLQCPHKDLDKIYETHKEVCENDPLFYRHLAAWYFTNGDIRDSKQVFVICLCSSKSPEDRNVGLALLRQLPPFQVQRVVDYLNKIGNVPRSARTEVERYLREREADNQWLDKTVLTARKSLKRLYALLHIKPSDRAQDILFDNDPPQDSQLYTLKQLTKCEVSFKQAKLIKDNKIPYRVASSVVKNVTPTVLYALIEVMTSQELINNLNAINKRGASKNIEIQKLIKSKLHTAKTDKNVSALKKHF